MTTNDIIERLRKSIGIEHKGSETIKVTADLIQRYCAAVGEDNPLYTSEEAATKAGFKGVVAPPTMFMGVGWVTFPKIASDLGQWYRLAGLALHPLAAIVAGDSLESTVSLKDVYAKTGRTGTTVFIVWQAVFVNQDGIPVFKAENSTAMLQGNSK